jgi:uncharacterized paraquat-inducible protein A
LDHRESETHKCPSHRQICQTPAEPQPQRLQQLATKMLEEPQTLSVSITNLQRNLFAGTFTLVLLDEVLRQISHIRNSPFLEPNIYIAMASQWLTPYLASPIILLTTCFILFATKKLASKNQKASNPYINRLKKAMPVEIYAIIAVICVFSITNWLFILLT